MKFLFFICVLLAFSGSVFASSEYDDEDIPPYVEIEFARDFTQLAKIARSECKIILLEVSASDCDYCVLLEDYYIKPMLRSEDYNAKIIIRKMDADSFDTLIDFSGNKTTGDKLAQQLSVKLTPTMLFFDSDGNEVAQRIIGINTLELFGGYIDAAIKTGRKAIASGQQ